MIDLWQVLRTTWLSAFPVEQPAGVGIRKVTLRRGELLAITGDELAVMLSGAITDRVSAADGSVGVIRRYESRDPILLPVGELRSEVASEVLVLLGGWHSSLEEAAAVVQMMVANELLATKRRLASVMTETIEQRVRGYLLAERIDPASVSPTVVSHFVGCSRERASQVISKMKAEIEFERQLRETV